MQVGFAAVGSSGNAVAREKNPFTPKAFLIRYWDKAISNKSPKSSFLLSKASPLTAAESATFAQLAANNALATRLPEFCSSAHLLCFAEVRPRLDKHDNDENFASYQDNTNFTNYGTRRPGGLDSFQHYIDSEDAFGEVNDFRRYSRNSAGHEETFSSYGTDSNVVEQSFHTYGTGAAGGAGEFKSYTGQTNVPNLRFTSYSDAASGRTQSFSSYSEGGNSGDESFTSYGKNGMGAQNEFAGYGTNSNVVGSGFSNYGETGNGGNNRFTNYGREMNNPVNTFRNYGAGGQAATESFANYREDSNTGDDSFKSYAKKSKAAQVDFTNYGKSFNDGTDTFAGYGEKASDHKVGFQSYGVKNTFKDYAKEGISFTEYTNTSSALSASMAVNSSLVNNWVEPGKFFRESMLKEGTVMPMPDIRDKLPERSFLPRSILSKLPFSTEKISELKQIFKVADNSTMDMILTNSLSECERAPSQGETKRCVGSIEDLIDFATSVLGRNVVVRTTENINGSKRNVTVGSIKPINGGDVTKSVSCHQSLFPYLLYYCHSVPKVRVYEADLLDPSTKAKINRGVAICHLDTRAWSPTHGAFLDLGSGPGRIEVCHWIFQNDMTWTTAV